MALRLLHLADMHFGMENYGRLDAATGLNRRLLDFARSVHHAIDYALEYAHLAIFAGISISIVILIPLAARLCPMCTTADRCRCR